MTTPYSADHIPPLPTTAVERICGALEAIGLELRVIQQELSSAETPRPASGLRLQR